MIKITHRVSSYKRYSLSYLLCSLQFVTCNIVIIYLFDYFSFATDSLVLNCYKVNDVLRVSQKKKDSKKKS